MPGIPDALAHVGQWSDGCPRPFQLDPPKDPAEDGKQLESSPNYLKRKSPSLAKAPRRRSLVWKECLQILGMSGSGCLCMLAECFCFLACPGVL